MTDRLQSALAVVVTTIQKPTSCMQQLAERLRRISGSMIVVGDAKGPSSFPLNGVEFLSWDQQDDLPYRLARLLPTGHYARKNLGYLVAIERGVHCIYETDDDNAPLESWKPRSIEVQARAVEEGSWVNVFRLFSDELIWPRGFPLEHIRDSLDHPVSSAIEMRSVRAPVQQGLANGSPDVDAVWRLVFDRPITFRDEPSLVLPAGSWCPFNSQSTWWWPDAYPLMYLPSHCSFRMTDIWRSLIAQRCLWAMGSELVFHPPEVVQERNEHDLHRDFVDEIPGYTGNAKIVDVLEALDLSGSVEEDLLRCYEALVDGEFFPSDELPLVRAWTRDVTDLLSRD